MKSISISSKLYSIAISEKEADNFISIGKNRRQNQAWIADYPFVPEVVFYSSCSNEIIPIADDIPYIECKKLPV